MVMPSTAVILVSVVVFPVLLAIDWYLGGMVYSPKPRRMWTEDAPKSSDAGALKKAA